MAESPWPERKLPAKGLRLFLQSLNRHCSCRTHRPRLPVSTRFSTLAAIGLVDQATLGFTARSRFSAWAGQTTGATGHLNLDLLRRIIARHNQLDQRPLCSWLTITAIAAVGTMPRLTPGATRRLAIGTVEAEKSWCASTTASIHQ